MERALFRMRRKSQGIALKTYGESVKSEKSHCMSKQHCEKLLKQQGVDLQAQIHPKRKVSFDHIVNSV